MVVQYDAVADRLFRNRIDQGRAASGLQVDLRGLHADQGRRGVHGDRQRDRLAVAAEKAHERLVAGLDDQFRRPLPETRLPDIQGHPGGKGPGAGVVEPALPGKSLQKERLVGLTLFQPHADE